PALPLSAGAPVSAVLASAESATLDPKTPLPLSPVPLGPVQLAVQLPTSFDPCWLQTPAERVNTHAAPALPLSTRAPTSAVLPSADSATLYPNWPLPLSPVPLGPVQLAVQLPTSFAPCWLQTPAERVNTHAA